MENCITTISNIEVATDEVKALKDSYLQSVQKECEAMKMVVSAIDGENADYLTQADSLIAEAATLRSDYQTKLQAIANEQGIVVNQDCISGTKLRLVLCSICQINLCLYSWISSGIQDLTANNFFNF